MSLRIPRSFAVPFLFSAALSATTVGARVHWQDSGIYLSAIHELGVLYQPGFVVYQLLCAGWTRLLFFVDFVLAVHLFSSVCAAGAAGLIGLAARDLTGARSGFFRIDPDRDAPFAEVAGMAAGVLAASGYTFWAAAILAKGYSFFYAVLAALLWRMIRAAETGRPRDFTIVAALIGLAWAAHPSAALAGAALVAFVAAHARIVGAKGLAGRILLAAAAATGPSLAFLPLLARSRTLASMGSPSTPLEAASYLLGHSFVGTADTFGFVPERWASIGLYFFQEYLVIGIAAVAVGAWRARSNGRLLLFAGLWSVPYLAVTAWFKIEGQHDHWFVAGWLPLVLLAAPGMARLARAAGGRAVAAAAVLAAGAAIVVNAPLLSLRDYDLAERYGRLYLEPASRHDRAIVVLQTDDSLAVCGALQTVRRRHPNVLVVSGPALEEGQTGRPSWYDRRLLELHPWVKPGDYEDLRQVFGSRPGFGPSIAAFVNANAGVPLYLEEPPPLEMIRADYDLVPAGILWRLVPSGERTIDRRDWDVPISPEAVAAREGRSRGQHVSHSPSGIEVRAEPYERRLLRALLRARVSLGLWEESAGRPREAAELLRSAVSGDPRTFSTPPNLLGLGRALIDLGSPAEAETYLKDALQAEAAPALRARIHFALARAAAARGDAAASAAELQRAIVTAPALAEHFRSEARAAGLLPD